MASKTIIIESNRNIAYRAENAEISTAEFIGSVEQKDSNNRWQTYIPDGLQINTGDQINLEASMINSIGGGDEVMEFTGNTNNQYGGQVISDRSVGLRLNYYISNRYQFNFNFPKSTCQVNYMANTPDYGGPAFFNNKAGATSVDDFNVWEKNYPFQCLEGFSTDVTATPRVYTPADPSLKPSYMKPPPELYNPSDNRLWIGAEQFRGPYYAGDDVPTDLYQWSPFFSQVILTVPEGFNTPASVGEVLTSQLHARQGNAVSWDVTQYPPSQFNIDATTGAITDQITPAITDSTYLTFPTSTGKPFYQRQQGKWNGAFNGEKSNGTAVPEGTNFQPSQGQEAFYNFIMTNKPEYYRGMTNAYAKLQQRPAGTLSDLSSDNYNNFTIHSGPNSGINERFVVNTNYGVGVLGNNVCLLDKLPHQQGEFVYYDTKQKKNVQVDADALNLIQGNGITTNIFFNGENLESIAGYIQYAFQVEDDSTNQDRKNRQFLKSHTIPFYFGRIDDQQSLGAGGRLVQLTATGQTIDPVAENSYYPQENTLADGTTVTVSTMLGRGEGWVEHLHSVYAINFDPGIYNAENAMNNSIPGLGNLYPHNAESKFMTAHPTGDLSKLKDIWKSLNFTKIISIGLSPLVVPVFYKDQATATASKTGPNAYDVPFCCFIYDNGNHNMPLPAEGEFCMFDTSLSACQLSIIATTQKKQASGLYPQPSTANGGLNTRPEQYMPYCYAGASDSLINFDSGYSKFTLSQFHTPVKTGNGSYQNPTEPPNDNPEQDILSVNEQEAHMTSIDNENKPVPYTDQIAVPIKQPVISAQAGIAIEFIYLFLNTGKPVSEESSIQIEYYNQDYYVGSLLDKLGFTYEQVCPFYGQSQCQFNRGNYNKYLGNGQNINVKDKFLNMVKPFTTNAYISSAEQIALTQQLAITKTANNNTIDIVVPSGKLGGTILKQATTNAVSDLLIGINMPRKLSYPYLVVYTDIIRNAIYYGGPNGHERLNAIAYITRNYAEGDFFYSFTTNWTYTADTDYVITSITTDIRLPDGTPAPIDNNSSVIYKVVKPQVMPVPPMIPPPKKEKREQDKDA